MLPSARPGMAPVPMPTRGRAGNVGEGRQSRSRSSSSDSAAFERPGLAHRRSLSNSSDDDEESSSTPRALAGGTTAVHPSAGFQWGRDQAQNGFGFGANSAFSLFTSKQANANGTQPAPISASGIYPATSLTLPSKVYHGDGFLAAFAASPSSPNKFSPGGPAGSINLSLALPSAVELSTPTSAVENGNNSTVSAQSTTPQAASVIPASTSSPPESQNSEHQGHSASDVPSNNACFNALRSTREGVSTDQPFAATQQPQLLSVENTTESSQITSNIGFSTSDSVSGSDSSLSAQNLPYSIHNFLFASAPLAYTGSTSENSQIPSLPDVTHTDETRGTALPPAHRRKVSNSNPATGQTSEDNTGIATESTDASQTDTHTSKKRRMRKDDERKRGSWRMQTYSSPYDPASEPERPFSTLPGKPLFSITAPVSSETTPLPHFEYKESRERTKRTSSAHFTQDAAASRSNVGPTVTAHGDADRPTFENMYEGLDTTYSFDMDTDVSTYADEYQSSTQDGALDGPRFPSDSSQGSGPPNLGLSSSSSLESIGEGSSQSLASGRARTPISARREGAMHYGSAALLDERTAATSADHLVSVVIEDNRMDHLEPSFVELILPLRPDGNGAFWLDAIELCNALQSGPSRIDGPAKVYVFRGRFRQYFLRISVENIDNFAPANLSVPADRFLRLLVESTLPSTNHPAAGSSSHPGLLQSPIDFTQLASPAPSEERLPAASGLISRPSQPLKRRRDQSPATAPRSSAAPNTSASGPAAKEKEPDTSDPAAPRSSYYRKRAL